MAVRSIEEIMQSIRDRFNDDTSDETLGLIEDINDTLNDYNTKTKKFYLMGGALSDPTTFPVFLSIRHRLGACSSPEKCSLLWQSKHKASKFLNPYATAGSFMVCRFK